MWEQPPFFCILALQLGLGQGLVRRLMAFRDSSSSSTQSLMRTWYASHVSPSWYGLLQGTQAHAPHLVHVHMSCLSFSSSSSFETLSWTCLASQSGFRHQRHPAGAVLLALYIRSRTSNLTYMVSVAAISILTALMTASHSGHAMPNAFSSSAVVVVCALLMQ